MVTSVIIINSVIIIIIINFRTIRVGVKGASASFTMIPSMWERFHVTLGFSLSLHSLALRGERVILFLLWYIWREKSGMLSQPLSLQFLLGVSLSAKSMPRMFHWPVQSCCDRGQWVFLGWRLSGKNSTGPQISAPRSTLSETTMVLYLDLNCQVFCFTS